MKNVFIYALNCPMTGRTRYIGKAVNPHVRYKEHILRAERGNTHTSRWIRSLIIPPTIEIIDEVLESEWPALEAAYIQFFREEGFDLTNATDGGEGITMTPETRAKVSASMAGKKNSLGCKFSIKTRAAISAALLGNKYSLGVRPSAETRAKLSAARRGRKLSPEHCAAISAGNLGKKKSPEHCATLRAFWAARKASRG